MSFLPYNPLEHPPGEIGATHTHEIQHLRHNSPFLGCRFDPTGDYVFAGAQDNSIQRWRLGDEQKVELTGHQSWVRALAFHAEQKKLFSGDYAGKILVWNYDADSPTRQQTIDAHRGWVRALAVSPDGRVLASSGNDNLIKLWNPTDGRLLQVLTGHEHQVYNIAYHPSGTHLVSIDHHGVIKDWDLQTNRAIRTFDGSVLHRYDTTFRAHIGGARGISFKTDGSQFACSGFIDVTNAFAGVGKPCVLVFNWQNGERAQLIRPQDSFQGTSWGVRFHPEGFLMAVGGGRGGALWFLRPNQATAYHTIRLPNNARDLDLNRDGRRIAIPFFDNSVRIYDLAY